MSLEELTQWMLRAKAAGWQTDLHIGTTDIGITHQLIAMRNGTAWEHTLLLPYEDQITWPEITNRVQLAHLYRQASAAIGIE